MPRTTFTLDKDLHALIRSYADERGLRMSGAVSELLRRGLSTHTLMREVNGFFVFDLPADSPRVTPEDVRRALAD